MAMGAERPQAQIGTASLGTTRRMLLLPPPSPPPAFETRVRAMSSRMRVM
jgi:hypothetical protein